MARYKFYIVLYCIVSRASSSYIFTFRPTQLFPSLSQHLCVKQQGLRCSSSSSNSSTHNVVRWRSFRRQVRSALRCVFPFVRDSTVRTAPSSVRTNVTCYCRNADSPARRISPTVVMPHDNGDSRVDLAPGRVFARLPSDGR